MNQKPTDRKNTLLHHTITMLTDKLAERDAEIVRLNQQLVAATDRELMLRKNLMVCARSEGGM